MKSLFLLAIVGTAILSDARHVLKTSSSEEDYADNYDHVLDNDYFDFAYAYEYDWGYEILYEAGPNEDNDHFEYETIGLEMFSNVDFYIYLEFFSQYSLTL